MKERPILFSAAMVRAILQGTKTQTRRVVKPGPPPCQMSADAMHVYRHGWRYSGVDYACERDLEVCPYGIPGDRLWVRETCFVWGRWVKDGLNKREAQRWRFKIETPHTAVFDPTHPQIATRTTPREMCMYWKRPSIFMPRWASRITLEITDVRVQRLQEISEPDARAEGCDKSPKPTFADSTFVRSYESLWNKINTKRGFGWDTNPWVWALTFKRVTA